MVWMMPIQLAVSFVWLAVLLGPAFLVSVAVMLIFFPLQALITKRLFKMRVRQSELADKRVKLVNELVQGVRVLKLYAWEESLQQRSESVRRDELRHLQRQRMLGASMGTIGQVQPLAITVATFSLYGATNTLTAATVITALSVFNQLRGPLGFLPMLIQLSVNIKVSLTRMQRVLVEPELPPFATERGANVTPHAAQPLPHPQTEAAGRADVAVGADGRGLDLGTAPQLPNTRLLPPSSSAAAAAAAAAAVSVTLNGSFRWPAPRPMDQVRTPAGRPKKRLLKGFLGKTLRLQTGKGHGDDNDASALQRPRLAESAVSAALAPAPIADAPSAAAAGPTLSDLCIDAPEGRLTIICGSVGSGKSSALSALLGEIPTELADGSGSFGYAALERAVGLRGVLGYFAQTPFILNDTVRGNILLGAPMDGGRYDAVIDACALPPDLKLLPGGDLTQIGEKGVNLSGGQKARIAFARLVYACHSACLLDDPLSAVDAHVGKHLFERVLRSGSGLLGETTRVLVTQQSQYLPHADHVVLMDEGRVVASGTYEDVRDSQAGRELLAALQTVGGGGQRR